MRIVVLIVLQVIRINFSEWVVVVVVSCLTRRGLKLLEDIDILANYGIIAMTRNTMIPNLPFFFSGTRT